MMRAFVVVGMTVASACGAPQPPHPTEPVTATVPAHAELVCQGERRTNCNATITLAVTNPRSFPVFVERVRYDAATGAISMAPRFVVDAGGVTVVTIHAHRARTLRVPLEIRDQAGALIMELEPTPIVVTNPAREAAERACRACNGDWSVFGAPPEDPTVDAGETCNCRTTDVGTACHDSDACQGWCNADGFTVVETRGGIAYGYTSGTCSELVQQHTCGPRIPHGAAKKPLRVKPAGTEDLWSTCVEPLFGPDFVVQFPGDDGRD